jgi:hypothetical protein
MSYDPDCDCSECREIREYIDVRRGRQWRYDLEKNGRPMFEVMRETAAEREAKRGREAQMMKPKQGEDTCRPATKTDGPSTPSATAPVAPPNERKNYPLTTGLLDYFPDALMAVAECSRVGNEQHNPGEPLAWDRSKSTDEADALLRHLIDRGHLDGDGIRHSAKVAWRALALLQKELEEDT